MPITSARERLYSSGQLAQLTGVPFENIRYFERIGLIPSAMRQANGRRLFNDEHRRKLVFIRRARELGFSQDEVRTLLQLSDGTPSRCADAKLVADTHLASIRARIADLQRMERLLADLSLRCAVSESSRCPVFDVFSGFDKQIA